MKLKLWLTAAIIAVWMLLIAASCQGGVAFDLIWSPSLDSNRVTGYILYWGPTNATPSTLPRGTNLTASVSNLQAGITYHFWVTAHDALGQESEPSNVLRYSVPEENHAPILERIDPFGVFLGTVATVVARAVNAETNQTLLFTLDNPPSWASIDPVTGRLTMTPTNAGTFPITVRVTDNGTPALSDQCTFTLTVMIPPPPRPPTNLRIILQTAKTATGPWTTEKELGLVQLLSEDQKFFRTRMEIERP